MCGGLVPVWAWLLAAGLDERLYIEHKNAGPILRPAHTSTFQ
jgi:hypothetical protein